MVSLQTELPLTISTMLPAVRGSWSSMAMDRGSKGRAAGENVMAFPLKEIGRPAGARTVQALVEATRNKRGRSSLPPCKVPGHAWPGV